MSRQPYFEHDNRGPSTSRFRGAPLMGRQRKFRDIPRGGGGGGKSRLLDLDGDVDMMAHPTESSSRRFNPYAANRNNNRKKPGRKHGGKSKHVDSDGRSWYRITIPHGKKSGKAFVLKAITSLCKAPFVPVNFQFIGNNAEFYVNNPVSAFQIRDVHRRVTTPDGFKMAIHTTKCSAPVAAIDSESIKVIEECMSSHYDAITHILNLSNFHHDERLKSIGLYAPLNKPIVINTVMRIIKERIPEIEVLNLSDNKLYTLEPLNVLVPVCKQLKSLIVKNNKLRSVNELNSLKGMEIIELVIDGNPLCDDFKDKTSYISAVRDRFPKLLSLDGHVLPAPIGFDLGPETTCPVSKKCFFADSGGPAHKDLVIQFLDQYYTIYDSGDRSKLLDAYHEHASFSLSLSRHAVKTTSLSAYIQDNRNLRKVTDFSERFKLLKQGKLSIVTALSEMPQTMHDPTSFSVDIYHISFQPALMSFSVIGVFKEVGAEINNATLKTFSRTFVVAPHNSGIVIINETLFIAHASQDQQGKAFKVPAPTPSPSPAPSNEEKSPSEKQLMVIELSKQTLMNLDFSAKCLEENDWDYQRAVAVFMKFQSEGKIPPEAFINL